MSNSQCTSLWQSCLLQVKNTTTEEIFASVFSPVEPISFQEGVLRLRLPNSQHIGKIEAKIQLIAPFIKQYFGQQVLVRYAIPEQTPEKKHNQNYDQNNNLSSAKFLNPGAQQNIPFNSQLIPKLTLDTFVEGECNKLAKNAGKAICENPGNNSFNPLFIYGNSGLGKTHIAQAIGNKIKENNDNNKVLYISANKFQAQFQYAAINGELSNFIQFYQLIDTLIIDDIQEFAGKVGTQNTFFNIFNHLHMLGKQLILTSDRPPVELKDIDERLITRFKWGLSAEITIPNLETKINILNSKARKLNINAPYEVIEFIAQNSKSNVRELEGTLNSLKAHSSLLGEEITLKLARNILKNLVEIHNTDDITVENVLNTTSDYFKLTAQDILSKKRTREVVMARQMTMLICKNYINTPLATIGKKLGGKTHATVIYAAKTIQNIIDTDKIAKQHFQNIKAKLYLQ